MKMNSRNIPWDIIDSIEAMGEISLWKFLVIFLLFATCIIGFVVGVAEGNYEGETEGAIHPMVCGLTEDAPPSYFSKLGPLQEFSHSLSNTDAAKALLVAFYIPAAFASVLGTYFPESIGFAIADIMVAMLHPLFLVYIVGLGMRIGKYLKKRK